MAEPPPYPDTGVVPDREPTTGTPRWVKLFGIVALALVLVVVVMLVAGGGQHGPGRHSGSAESGAAGGHKPPAGDHTP